VDGVRFSKVISFGNGVDLRETELLDYLGRDPETRVIAMYMEGWTMAASSSGCSGTSPQESP
jgi:acyl-CoA synthetase (NDP forming)